MVTKKPTKKSLDADTWIHPLDDLLARQASILEISESMDSSIVDQGDIRYIAQNALRIKRRAPWLLDKSYSEEDFLDDVVALIAAENDEFEKLNSEVKLTRASISKVTKELQKLNFQFMEKIRELTTNGAPYIHALHDIKKAVNRKHGSKILSESLIIVSVADFETFVSRMFGLVIKHNKGIYSNQDSKLKWKDISKFSSIEDAEDFLISSKRQEFTHLSMREWLDWFGKHSNVVMPPQVRKHVLQTYEVRNTLVHKSSHKVKLPKDFDIETLEVFLDLLGATAIIISAGTASVALKVL